ncbi:hypothetical protein HD553DRAFT_366721 [Filobasidium floriforme]|uniref:uncharacterized protein n=1 Tax=Filobasidium floriforme TaxID=5210 RepID=UPI001E8CB431|nr:uncharacterized protein HD553DRAFT_366721 [Filobasidium floriforme]KAH8088525.1 hypothetical protein HD553DRAFT_366721 [Filobasidium floriforme]
MLLSNLFALVPLLGAIATKAARCPNTLPQGGTTAFARLSWVQPHFGAENVIENQASSKPVFFASTTVPYSRRRNPWIQTTAIDIVKCTDKCVYEHPGCIGVAFFEPRAAGYPSRCDLWMRGGLGEVDPNYPNRPLNKFEGGSIRGTCEENKGIKNSSTRAQCWPMSNLRRVKCHPTRNVIKPRGHASTFPRICYQSVGEFASELEIGESRRAWPKGGKWPGQRQEGAGGDCAAIVLGRDRVIVPLGLPRLLWEREGVYIPSTPTISIPHHHPHPRPSFDKTFLANSHNS